MKYCGICKETKPEEEFNRKGAGLQSQCRLCQRAYGKERHQRNKDVRLAKLKEQRAARRQETLEWLNAYLTKNPCVDCGYSDIRALEFDHRGDKEYNISEMIQHGYSLESVLIEVEKCDVRCANCHRIKTYSQLNYTTKE